MKYVYYNANPKNRQINDCTIRAISLATNKTWRETFKELCAIAEEKALMPDDTSYIDDFLEKRFQKIYACKKNIRITVEEFINTHSQGTYLITMRGHITCSIDGIIYDTFNPKDRFIWGAYKV